MKALLRLGIGLGRDGLRITPASMAWPVWCAVTLKGSFGSILLKNSGWLSFSTISVTKCRWTETRWMGGFYESGHLPLSFPTPLSFRLRHGHVLDSEQRVTEPSNSLPVPLMESDAAMEADPGTDSFGH